MATKRKKKAKQNPKTKKIQNLPIKKQFLPPEIIADILTRVPLKSLIRFRCVCKRWSNQIFDEFFINLHSQRSPPSTPNFIFYDYETPNLFFFDILNNKQSKRDLDLQPQEDYDVSVLYSCNGLILLRSMRRLVVYNPVTKRVASVSEVEMEGVDYARRLFGMGFDMASGKFKIVCVGYSNRDEYVCKVITVGVDEGDDESWSKIEVLKPHHFREYPPVFGNGALHWMIGSMDVENLESNFEIEPESVGKIVTLDLQKEEFYTIQHPRCELGVYTLLESNGELCFLDHVSNTQLKIWSLKNLELNEWEEMCSVDLGHLEKMGRLPFKGFLEDCFPFVMMMMNSEQKIVIKSYDAMNDYPCFFTYDMELKELGGGLGVDCSWVPYGSEFEQKFFPLKHVNSLVAL